MMGYLDDIYTALLVHFNNLDKNTKNIKYYGDARFGNSFELGKYSCEIFNIHKNNVTIKFLEDRKRNCLKGHYFYGSDYNWWHYFKAKYLG